MPMEVMMVAVKNKLDDLVGQAEHMLVTALADPMIARALEAYGYDPERIAAGMSIQREVNDLQGKVRSGLGNLSDARLRAALERADPVYQRSLGIARVAFREHPKAACLLKLHGERNRSVAGWLDQTEAFYRNLTREDGLCMAMMGYGYTEEKIAYEYRLQKDVRDHWTDLLREAGEAPQQTEKRIRREVLLDLWMADFRAVAKVALGEHPRQLERLGLNERS